jgi:hypothetical protein
MHLSREQPSAWAATGRATATPRDPEFGIPWKSARIEYLRITTPCCRLSDFRPRQLSNLQPPLTPLRKQSRRDAAAVKEDSDQSADLVRISGRTWSESSEPARRRRLSASSLHAMRSVDSWSAHAVESDFGLIPREDSGSERAAEQRLRRMIRTRASSPLSAHVDTR